MDHSNVASGSGLDAHPNGLPQFTFDPPSPSDGNGPSHPETASGPSDARRNLDLSRITRPRQQSIRLRRLPSSLQVNSSSRPSSRGSSNTDQPASTRRRSASAPLRPDFDTAAAVELFRERTSPSHLAPVTEETPSHRAGASLQPLGQPVTTGSRLRSASDAARSAIGLPRSATATATATSSEFVQPSPAQEYDSQLVDLLDVIDPEVATLNTLTNVQNSLFIPNLGKYVNRQGTYNLTRRPTDLEDTDSGTETPTISSTNDDGAPEKASHLDLQELGLTQITSVISRTPGHYAALPRDVSLEGWSEADKAELNDHVRHLLHSRRAKFKRGLKGFGQYLSHPLGFLVTLYATLITLFGLAWVLFLIGWVNVGGRKLYITNVIDNVLVALFAIVGDGLAPFRIVDTYHMIYIAHYHRLSWRLRKERGLPTLADQNDLPSRHLPDIDLGLVGTAIQDEDISVLSPEQQQKLDYHQKKFSSSHTFYKPHETSTHHAFPLRLLIVVVILLDFHSLLQISLGSCTWAISYHHRPFALTTIILCCSICVNISAGITITVGDRKTRKKDVIEKLNRQALTKDAMEKIRKARRQQKKQLDLEGVKPLKTSEDKATSSIVQAADWENSHITAQLHTAALATESDAPFHTSS